MSGDEPSSKFVSRRHVLRTAGVAAGGLPMGSSTASAYRLEYRGRSGDEPDAADRNSAEHVSGTAPTYARPREGNTDVLLIKDCNPWGETTNEDVLREKGVSYDLINSSSFAEQPLTEYCGIIIPSTQDQTYYDTLYDARAKLAEFVAAGNVLAGHVGDAGAPCTTEWMDPFLPDAVTKETEHLDSIEIVAGGHPVVDGLADADVSGWNYSTHGRFTSYPADASVVMGVAGNPGDEPTYLEYPHGNGVVLATMMPLEWGGSDRRVLENEVAYMLRLCDELGECVPRREAGRDTPAARICASDRTLTRSDTTRLGGAGRRGRGR